MRQNFLKKSRSVQRETRRARFCLTRLQLIREFLKDIELIFFQNSKLLVKLEICEFGIKLKSLLAIGCEIRKKKIQFTL